MQRDRTGSAMGALAASLFLLPIYGLITTLIIFSLLCFGGLFGLGISMRHQQRDTIV